MPWRITPVNPNSVSPVKKHPINLLGSTDSAHLQRRGGVIIPVPPWDWASKILSRRWPARSDSPADAAEARDKVEVLVLSNNRLVVLESQRCDPDVVFGERGPAAA